MKRRKRKIKKIADKFVSSVKTESESISEYIDDQGNIRFLLSDFEVSKVALSITLNHPKTGEPDIISVDLEMPSEEKYLNQLKDQDRLQAKNELENANLLLEKDEALLQKLSKIIEYKQDGVSAIINRLATTSINEKTLFFRVRKKWSENDSINKVKDVSYVPDDKRDLIKYGRLNNRKEQVMYLADTYLTAMKEARIEPGDRFYLSLFINMDQLNLVNINEQIKGEGNYGKVEKEISKFLFSEFTKIVEYNKTYKYRISNLIAKNFYSYKINGLDGWIYPSIARNNAVNIALDRQITDKKIKFLVSFYGEQISETDFTLENPLIQSFNDDDLVELKSIINTENMVHYNNEILKIVENFWLSFKK